MMVFFLVSGTNGPWLLLCPWSFLEHSVWGNTNYTFQLPGMCMAPFPDPNLVTCLGWAWERDQYVYVWANWEPRVVDDVRLTSPGEQSRAEGSRSSRYRSVQEGPSRQLYHTLWVFNWTSKDLSWSFLASSPGHSQILSHSLLIFLHDCEIKSGSGPGTRLGPFSVQMNTHLMQVVVLLVHCFSVYRWWTLWVLTRIVLWTFVRVSTSFGAFPFRLVFPSISSNSRYVCTLCVK